MGSVPSYSKSYSTLSQIHQYDFCFGGTSLLIVVSVMLDTVRQMESYMVTGRTGFMKS